MAARFELGADQVVRVYNVRDELVYEDGFLDTSAEFGAQIASKPSGAPDQTADTREAGSGALRGNQAAQTDKTSSRGAATPAGTRQETP